ncbi:MAG: tetratricopeptide repeat protein [Acidobacteriaceae bacterium]|nr:tetratricopeptide repeat protein [Acidobacteriaceae bacterium]
MRKTIFSAAWLACGVMAWAQQTTPPAEPTDLTVRLQAAQSSLESKDYRGAESLLTPLANEFPDNADVQFDLGFAQDHLDENDAAIASYKASIKADPKYVPAHDALARLYFRLHRVDDARTELNTIASMDDAPAEAKGQALRMLANLDQSANPQQANDEILAAMKATGEKSSDAGAAGVLALRSGDYADAEQQYLKVLSADPTNVDARVGLGTALIGEKKFEDAAKTLVIGLKTAPDDSALNVTLAEAYANEGKDDEAITVLETLRKKTDAASSTPEAVDGMLARLYLMNDRPADAEPLLRELIAKTNDPALEDALGEALVKQAKYPEAEKVLAQAFAQRAAFHNDNAWGEAASHLAFAADRNAHPQVALQALQARSTVLPDTPASLFLQATSYDALHQYKDAAHYYHAFLAVSGGQYPDEEFKARHRLVALQQTR